MRCGSTAPSPDTSASSSRRDVERDVQVGDDVLVDRRRVDAEPHIPREGDGPSERRGPLEPEERCGGGGQSQGRGGVVLDGRLRAPPVGKEEQRETDAQKVRIL